MRRWQQPRSSSPLAAPPGRRGWGRGGISVNRCRFSGWRTAATRAVRKRRAAAQPSERGGAAATQRADGRARRSRWMRAAGTIEARGGADGRARRGRLRRAAGTIEARGGADRRARRERLRRAAGPTDAHGGDDLGARRGRRTHVGGDDPRLRLPVHHRLGRRGKHQAVQDRPGGSGTATSAAGLRGRLGAAQFDPPGESAFSMHWKGYFLNVIFNGS